MSRIHILNKDMQDCIKICESCEQVCIETIFHCLAQGGQHVNPEHINLLYDCAEICQISAGFMSRHSDFHANICSMCAEICNQCALSCESMDDEQMKLCAEKCRQCAQSCQEMS